MSPIMYDVDGKVVTHGDLQDKGSWCSHGERKENIFIKKYGLQLGQIINPQKKINRYAPDLANCIGNGLADLKTQNTPFFTAGKYKYDPQYTVTFNKNDADRYRVNNPDIDIYFWVDWIAVRYFKESTNPKYGDTDISIDSMHGVWKVSFKDLDAIIQDSPLHQYQQRVNDVRGNARDSYLIDLNDNRLQRVI
ncbi:hypothetical protein AB1K89_06995 [Sporosarcina sp. 179-K 8C2 HS]|uniref:hypothetical protein n=1 Tax=Sporosarcina sp. 179-K 8C2 HS TaxID=3142387 RepID=UPI0039A37EAA